MKFLHKEQRGFGVLGVIVIGLVVLSLAGGVILLRRQNNKEGPTSTTPTPETSTNFTNENETKPSDNKEEGDKKDGKSKTCSLLTGEEVEKIIGYKILKITPIQETSDLSQCGYEFNMYGSSVNNQIVVQYGTSPADISLFNMRKNNPDTEAVSGLGDEALWYKFGVLDVKVGSAVLSINMQLTSVELNGGNIKPLAIEMAKIALERL